MISARCSGHRNSPTPVAELLCKKSIGETFDKLAHGYTAQELEFLVEYYKQSIELTKQEIAKLGKHR